MRKLSPQRRLEPLQFDSKLPGPGPVPKISVTCPIYQAEDTIAELIDRLESTLSNIADNYEIVLVNDGSDDASWEKLKARAAGNDKIIAINLSRNFGQHSAIAAGLEYCSGAFIVVMDCDLQDPPEAIRALHSKILEGFDVVFASRANRTDGLFKRMLSKWFFRFLGYLSGVRNDGGEGNFGIFSRKAIDAVQSMGDSTRWFPGMVRWVGFRQTSIPVEHGRRSTGKSTYSFSKLVHLAIDILLLSSEKPLRLIIKLGLTIAGFSFLFGLAIIYQTVMGRIGVAGWPSLIVSIWFLAGLIILILGFVGLYIGKVYNEVKGRPVFVVDEIVGSPPNGEQFGKNA